MIFIVDDDLTTTHALRLVLSRAGYLVISANTAAEGLKVASATVPDMVLLDIQLPDRSGFEVCRQLQTVAATRDVPVLFISSDNEVSSKVKAFQAGAVDYITKPIAAEEVLARVGTHIRLKQAYARLENYQADRICHLAGAQATIMPTPEELPESNFHVSLTQVGQAGGDFYDVIELGNTIVDYVVADASGHDLAASFWTSALKSLLAENVDPTCAPESILTSINKTLTRVLPSGIFFTAVYARLHRRTGKLELVNAANPSPLIVHRNTTQSTAIELQGDVVGAFKDAAFDSARFTLASGDRVLLFSDGLVETGGDRATGLEKIKVACEKHHSKEIKELVDGIVQDVAPKERMTDDVLLLGVEV